MTSSGLVKPRFMRLTAEFNVRGGIYTTIVAEQRQPGWQPEASPELLPSVCPSRRRSEKDVRKTTSAPRSTSV